MKRISAIDVIKKQLDNDPDAVVEYLVKLKLCPTDFGMKAFEDCNIAQLNDYERDGRTYDCKDCWNELRVIANSFDPQLHETPDVEAQGSDQCPSCDGTGLLVDDLECTDCDVYLNLHGAERPVAEVVRLKRGVDHES